MDIVATFERSSNVPLLYMPGDLSLYPPLPHAPPGGSDAWAARRLVMLAVSHCGLRRDVLPPPPLVLSGHAASFTPY